MPILPVGALLPPMIQKALGPLNLSVPIKAIATPGGDGYGRSYTSIFILRCMGLNFPCAIPFIPLNFACGMPCQQEYHLLATVYVLTENELIAMRACTRTVINPCPGLLRIPLEDIKKIEFPSDLGCYSRALEWYLPRPPRFVPLVVIDKGTDHEREEHKTFGFGYWTDGMWVLREAAIFKEMILAQRDVWLSHKQLSHKLLSQQHPTTQNAPEQETMASEPATDTLRKSARGEDVALPGSVGLASWTSSNSED